MQGTRVLESVLGRVLPPALLQLIFRGRPNADMLPAHFYGWRTPWCYRPGLCSSY